MRCLRSGARVASSPELSGEVVWRKAIRSETVEDLPSATCIPSLCQLLHVLELGFHMLTTTAADGPGYERTAALDLLTAQGTHKTVCVVKLVPDLAHGAPGWLATCSANGKLVGQAFLTQEPIRLL